MWWSICGRDRQNPQKRISEHKQAVKRCDPKNGIAVHVTNKLHIINWEEASVKTSETGYWKRRVQEAIRIQRLPNTMNLDCGIILSNAWTLALKLCWQQQFQSLLSIYPSWTCIRMRAITIDFHYINTISTRYPSVYSWRRLLSRNILSVNCFMLCISLKEVVAEVKHATSCMLYAHYLPATPDKCAVHV